MIYLRIPLEPKPQMRVKFARAGKFTRTYKHEKQANNENTLLFYLDKYRPEEPLSGPVFAEIICAFSRPKNHFGTGKNKGILKKNVPYFHTITPDIDNMLKMLFDCMNGIYFKDDKQICECFVKKIYANPIPFWDIKLDNKPIKNAF